MQPFFFWFADDQIHSSAVRHLLKEKYILKSSSFLLQLFCHFKQISSNHWTIWVVIRQPLGTYQSVIKEFLDIIIKRLELVRHASSSCQTVIEQSSWIIQVVVRQLLGGVFRQLLSGSCLAFVRQSSFLKQFSARFQDVIGLEKKTQQTKIVVTKI